MPNDDLTVGRCEALSDAWMQLPSWPPLCDPGMVDALESAWKEYDMTPAERVDNLIKQEQEKKNNLEERINESNSKLESLRSLRSAIHASPECAKAVQAALELLR